MAQQDQVKKGLLTALGVIVAIASVTYVFWGFDIIPDGTGSLVFGGITGFIDDAIVIMGGVLTLRRLKLIALPGKQQKISVPYLMALIVIWAWILWYFFWGFDIIPDGTPWIGFLDDIGNMFVFTRVLGGIRRGLRGK